LLRSSPLRLPLLPLFPYTTLFRSFGVGRFQGRTYYGGHYGSNNDNWYDLFSASGMDFIVISFEYDTTPDQAILDWGDQLLTTYRDRKSTRLNSSHDQISYAVFCLK